MDWLTFSIAAFAVTFIGVAKAGFGGGLGMLVTPLCVLAFGPKQSMVNLPVFAREPLITHQTLMTSLEFFPLVPLGVWIGVWLNRRFSEKHFTTIILAVLLLTSLQLIFNFDIAGLFHR